MSLTSIFLNNSMIKIA